MNEFVSWCRHLLVSFLFSFILVQSPKMFSLRSAHVDFMHAHAHAENLHEHAHVNKWRRSVSAVEEPHDLP